MKLSCFRPVLDGNVRKKEFLFSVRLPTIKDCIKCATSNYRTMGGDVNDMKWYAFNDKLVMFRGEIMNYEIKNEV